MNIQERESVSFFHTYKRLPLEIDHGEGVYLIAKDGTRYLDMFGGLPWMRSATHIPACLRNQWAIKEIYPSFKYFVQEPQVTLAELLLRYSGFSKVFFANSGAESIEGAMKLARKWGSMIKKTQFNFIHAGFSWENIWSAFAHG